MTLHWFVLVSRYNWIPKWKAWRLTTSRWYLQTNLPRKKMTEQKVPRKKMKEQKVPRKKMKDQQIPRRIQRLHKRGRSYWVAQSHLKAWYHLFVAGPLSLHTTQVLSLGGWRKSPRSSQVACFQVSWEIHLKETNLTFVLATSSYSHLCPFSLKWAELMVPIMPAVYSIIMKYCSVTKDWKTACPYRSFTL